jgi:hypothetical protein
MRVDGKVALPTVPSVPLQLFSAAEFCSSGGHETPGDPLGTLCMSQI